VQRLAAWAGLGTFDDRTPVESAEDLVARIGDQEAVRALARSFTRARYGGPEALEESEEQADAMDAYYAKVRGTLRRLIRRRIVRLGRVPGGPLARRSSVPGALAR
jgi:hypothetical protein